MESIWNTELVLGHMFESYKKHIFVVVGERESHLCLCCPSHQLHPSAWGEVGSVAVVIIVRADFLHQLVVGAVEGDVDADDFEGLWAKPGDMALRLLLEACLGWVVVAQRVLGALLNFLILDAAVEGLGVLGINDWLLCSHIKLYDLGRWHETDRYVALACWVVAEINTEGTIAVVDNLASNKKVELDCLNVGVEISPAEHLLEFSCLDHRPPFGPGPRVLELGGVSQPVP